MHPTDRLAAARKALEAAQREYDAALAEHQADYPWLHGDDKPACDLPPEEWQAGDVVEYFGDDNKYHWWTAGKRYSVVMTPEALGVTADDGDFYSIERITDVAFSRGSGLKFIYRP